LATRHFIKSVQTSGLVRCYDRLAPAIHAACKHQPCVLVAPKLPMVARSAKRLSRIIDQLAEHKARLATIEEGFRSNKMVQQMLRYLCPLTSHTQRNSGQAPYGTKVAANGRLEPQESEQETIELVIGLRLAGHTIRQIVDHLRKAKVKGRTKKPLGVAQVHSILKRYGA
jgi:hypothetical protein